MTTLVLVRHGQASALADDYDQLSSIGAEQGRRVGRHLGALFSGDEPPELLYGPRRRHAQTLAAMREAAPEIPDGALEADLDEHHGVQLVKLLTPHYAEREHPFGDAIRAVMQGGPHAHRAVGRMYQVALTAWMEGELEHPEVEPWSEFRARTRRFIRALAERDDHRTVVAITSGGAIAAMVTEAMGMDGPRALELMWALKNASVTRLRFGAPRFLAAQSVGPRRAHLEVFNETGHLGADEHLHTHV